MQAFRAYFPGNPNSILLSSNKAPAPSPALSHVPDQSPAPLLGRTNPHIYPVTKYGADPSGKMDSTDAILEAISAAVEDAGNGNLICGVVNLGGVEIFLEGGYYLINRPLKLLGGRGNLVKRSIAEMRDDDWLKVAWMEEAVVADLLLRLKEEVKPTPSSPPFIHGYKSIF